MEALKANHLAAGSDISPPGGGEETAVARRKLAHLGGAAVNCEPEPTMGTATSGEVTPLHLFLRFPRGRCANLRMQ